MCQYTYCHCISCADIIIFDDDDTIYCDKKITSGEIPHYTDAYTCPFAEGILYIYDADWKDEERWAFDEWGNRQERIGWVCESCWEEIWGGNDDHEEVQAQWWWM